MNQIKLVIWDLDETFWKGTLSEEGIEPIQKNIELVKHLTSRGIINSICSKNDFDQAKSKLMELGIWNYFVFPSIKWQPKGIQIKNIIEECQLRAPNVLFLDDNHLNLEEVKFYNEEIYAELPGFIHENIHLDAFKGKDDSSHSRLNQYKLLEKKHAAKTKYSSNVDFLKDSNIKIRLVSNPEDHKDRVYELLSRTNQLNFTKVRLDEKQTGALIQNKDLEMFLVHVYDRFGDYGFVGFVCHDPKSHRLVHFTFSCRILNLGVEQYIFNKLGRPHLEIQGDVVSDPTEPEIVDWIEEVDSLQKPKAILEEDNSSKQNLLFVGSCELGAVFNYLEAYSKHIDKHQVRVLSHNIPEFPDHLITLMNQLDLSEPDLDEVCSLPFLSREYAMSGKMFSGDYNAIIYSVVANYGQNVYRHKEKGFRIAWGEYGKKLTDLSPENDIFEYLEQKGFEKPVEFIKDFQSKYKFEGFLEPDKFIELLQRLRNNIPSKIPILFINGSEQNVSPDTEPEAGERHRSMNRALDRFLKNSDNCYLVDMRNIATGSEDMGRTIRSYQRHVYKSIADEIMSSLKHDLQINLEKDIKKDLEIKYNYFRKAIIKRIKTNPVLRNRLFLSVYRIIKKQLKN